MIPCSRFMVSSQLCRPGPRFESTTRNVGNVSVPTTRLLKVADVPDELSQSLRCTPDERYAQPTERREGVAHMVCD